MKKTLALAPLALLLVGAIACQDDPVDNVIDGPTDATDTSHLVPPRYLTLDALTKWFQEEYSVSFICQFSSDDYMQVAEGLPRPYTPATDSSRIKRLLYYISDEVLNVFPARTLAKYMPPTIYLVDSLKETYGLIDDLTNPANPVYSTSFFPITGQTTGEYLVIGNASSRFDDQKEGLREELLSLFVERLLYNTTLPKLDEFKEFSEDATRASGAVWEFTLNGFVTKVPMNYPYWDGLGMPGSTTERSYGATWVNDPKEETPWLGRGILKVGHSGCVFHEYRNLSGQIVNTYSFVKATLKQDFADFAAFITTTPAAEREAFYTQVEANKRCSTTTLTEDMRNGTKPIPDYFFQLPSDTLWYDARSPYGGTFGATAMRQKDAYVKTYFKTNLQIELE
jgi:hypothetical protein